MPRGRRRLADDRSPIGPDAACSVDTVGASGGLGRWTENGHTKYNHDGERSMFHCKSPGRLTSSVLADTGHSPAAFVADPVYGILSAQRHP
jgi:hypothetical protein